MLRNIQYISFLALLLFAAIGCNQTPEPIVSAEFSLNDSLLKRLLIDTVHAANTTSDLSLSAKIVANEDRQAIIYPMVSGTVKDVSVVVGDYVNKGQLLASLSSAEMAGFEAELVSASAALANADRSLKQTEALYNSGLASSKELEEAKNEFLVKQAEVGKARSVFRLNGGKMDGQYSISSPISGYITERNVNTNMQLRPDNDKPIFAVADLSVVSAMISVYESDIPKIKAGDEVEIALLAYPDRSFTGIVDKIYNVLDPESKVMNARVSIKNPDLILKPGMLATAKIQSRSSINLPVVSSRGIIFDDNKHYALLLDASNKLKIQEVEISRKSAGRAYISSGLEPGDRIIASRQVFIFESLKK